MKSIRKGRAPESRAGKGAGHNPESKGDGRERPGQRWKRALKGKANPADKPKARAWQILCGGRVVYRCNECPVFPAGFSLVETLVAMAIVFFLLAGTAQVLCYSFLLKQKADLHRISADLISRKVEVLKSLEPENEALTPGVHQETVQDRNSGRYFFLTWEVIEEEGLKKVQLSLYPAPFGSRPPLRVSWYRSETLGF